MNGILSQLQPLQRHLIATAARHQVVSNNIANVNTPSFKAQRLREDFDEELTAFQQVVDNDETNSERLDGNTVDIHYELGQLKSNSLLHSVYARVLNSKIRHIQQAMDTA